MIFAKNKGILLVLAAAFLLRLAGIGYGLPDVYHQDEPMMVHHALAIGTGDWNTHYFVIPPFVSYFLFVVYGAFYFLGHLAGRFADPDAFALYFLQDPTWFYLIGRFFVPVLFGTATVWLLYRMGRRFFSGETALLAALFLAVLPLHVQHSHYIYADTPVTFGMLALLYRILLLSEDRRFRSYLCLGLVLGWATSIKYTAAYAVPVIVGAHAWFFRLRLFSRESLLKIIFAGAVGFAFFAALAPFTFLDWTHFMATMRRQSAGESFIGWTHHLRYSLAGGTSAVFMLLAAIGAGLSLRRPRYPEMILLGLATLFYGINSVFTQHYARYVLPIVSVSALFAAQGWISVEKFFPNNRVRRLVLAAALAHLTWPAVYLDSLFFKADTRSLAARWFEENTRGGEVLAVDSRFFAPPLHRRLESSESASRRLGEAGLDALRRKRLGLLERAQAAEKAYTIYQLVSESDRPNEEFLFEKPFLKADVSELRRAGVEYVVFNYGEEKAAIHRLKEASGDALERVRTFSPYKDPLRRKSLDRHSTTAAPHLREDLFGRERLGPYLEIYRLKKTS